jgi:hypothetical protein
MSLTGDPLVPVQFTFYVVKRCDAFQRKKAGNLEPLSFLNVGQLTGCYDHDGLPYEEFMFAQYALLRRSAPCDQVF